MKVNKWIIHSGCLLLLACVCAVILTQPNRFQKWNSLKHVSSYQVERLLDGESYVDLSTFIKSIPYKLHPKYMYAVHPESRFRLTIAGGDGDCSNFSFGGAYYFLREGIDFELVHFLQQDSFFAGGGHVAVRVPYRINDVTGVGVIDIAGGGMPLLNGAVADYNDLQKVEPNLDFLRINDNAPTYFGAYYNNEYLESVSLGFTPSSDIQKYFSFIQRFYVPLGNDKFEKMTYDGLSLLLGQYYNIYVDTEFLNQFQIERFFFKSILILLRLLVLLVFFSVIYESFHLVLTFKKKVTIQHLNEHPRQP